MKEMLKAIYGKEWAWIKSLTLGQQLRVLYFAISFALALIVATSDSMLIIVLVVPVLVVLLLLL